MGATSSLGFEASSDLKKGWNFGKQEYVFVLKKLFCFVSIVSFWLAFRFVIPSIVGLFIFHPPQKSETQLDVIVCFQSTPDMLNYSRLAWTATFSSSFEKLAYEPQVFYTILFC